jgi:glycosyltransferase involved in cell wall biosynthesis
MSAPTADRRIHVMQATFGMSIGGMERVIADLCRYVDPERYRFTVCCLSVRGPIADEVEADGIPVIYCENQTRFGKYMRGFELGRLLRRERVDILHTHNTTAFIDGLIGARIAGVPIMIHTDHCKNYPIERRWMVAENVASRLVDKVVAVSNHTREELLHYEGLAPDKVTVIHNGINPRPPVGPGVAALRREFGFTPDQFIVGTVGRLEPQKGLDLLLASVPVIAATHPNARFVIVGGGTLEAELKEQARTLGILDRVIFTGWRTDAVALMDMIDCFVQTSNFEGLPMVLLEAMSLGKPIIACGVGGVPEVVEHEHTGLTVHTRAADDFGRAVIRLISDRELTARFGRQARARYEERFTAQTMASSYQQLYEQFLDQKKVQAA